MRNMLAFLAAVTLTVAGVGWYLGWYKIQSVPNNTGNSTFNIEVYGGKIGTDLKKGLQTVEQKLQKNSDSDNKEQTPAANAIDQKPEGGKTEGKHTSRANTTPKATLGVPSSPH